MAINITGYGALDELDLSEEAMIEFTDSVDNRGDFVRLYELDHSLGGNIIGSVLAPGADLKGRMFEFENCFIVAWSDGEYIDVGTFRKK